MFWFFKKKKEPTDPYEEYWNITENMTLYTTSASGQNGSHAGLEIKYIPSHKQVVLRSWAYFPKKGTQVNYKTVDIPDPSPSRETLMAAARTLCPMI